MRWSRCLAYIDWLLPDYVNRHKEERRHLSRKMTEDTYSEQKIAI